MALFFLKRPVLAWVVAIIVMLAGLLALHSLPVTQYPDIALPQVGVVARYPGASATIAEQSVTQVIERQMKGLDNLLYMRASSDASGNVEIYLTFAAGTNADMAQVQVQNALQQVMPQLPEAVQRQGVTVDKSVENSFMVIAFHAEGGAMRANDIADYVASALVDPLSRVQGVGSTTLYASQNAMRIWCDPERMHRFSLNPQDIVTAVREQNAQIPGGQAGAAPAPPGQEIAITVNVASRLETVEDFENINLRTDAGGHVLRLRDVARVELNEEEFFGHTTFNGHPGVGLAFKLATGANILETTAAIKAEVAALSRFFPPGLTYAYADDRAPIVEAAMLSVTRTLGEAVVLVVAVLLLFLGSFRATFIPAVALPVVLLGVLAVLYAAGFSLNTLTLFGMVLAVGLLVDDAIVVVENVDRLMRVQGLPPRMAVETCMRQITGALVGVAAVIAAAFLPMACMPGSTGVIYRQFSLAIVAAMALSVLVAVILTPTLCATLLRPAPDAPHGLTRRFHNWFDRLSRAYAVSVRTAVRAPRRWLGGFAGIAGLCWLLFFLLPTAFLPDEDQGVLYVDVQLPPGATLERTERVLAEIDRYFREEEGEAVHSVMTVSGWGFNGTGQNTGMVFPRLKDWSQRDGRQGAFAIVQRATARFADMPEASVVVMAPPAVMDLGVSGGFDMELLDRSGQGRTALLRARDALLKAVQHSPEIGEARYSGMDDAEQYNLCIDMDKAGALGLTKGEIHAAIGAYWGGEYINDFNDKGRNKKVYLQADPAFRTGADDFSRYHIRNRHGEMTPFSSFLTVHSALASPRLTRYQGVPSVKIEGGAAPGVSSGEAMRAMDAAALGLLRGFDHAWTGLSLQERMAGHQAPLLYAVSLLVVFLCLAALYESWTVPLAVMLAAPTGILGALVGAHLRGMHNDIYFQIALLTIVGLSAKNAILIVEFAKTLHDAGRNLRAATVEAARLRFRPIVMTSLCFMLGVVPLAVSSGAGAGAQNALGTAVLSGMLATTALGVYYTPVFFVLVTRLFTKKTGNITPNRRVSQKFHIAAGI